MEAPGAHSCPLQLEADPGCLRQTATQSLESKTVLLVFISYCEVYQQLSADAELQAVAFVQPSSTHSALTTASKGLTCGCQSSSPESLSSDSSPLLAAL